MTHASLFSGIGGCEVAAAMLGWENLFHCEINPFGRAVLYYWFPNSESYEDITKTNFSKWGGRVDVLTGGFPCQPFSYAGQRRGAEDDRYLWPEMLRAIQECKPTWVIGENVAGITTMVEQGEVVEVGNQTSLFGETDDLHTYEMRQRFTLERVCSDLESIGYEVQPILIPACAVGAPHRRDRVFILAQDTDGMGCKGELAERQYSAQFGHARTKGSNGRIGLSCGEGEPSHAGGANLNDTNCERFAPNEFHYGKSTQTRQAECRKEQFGRAIGSLAGDRWREFPTVSPVHRGNDGIPFDVDGLAIPWVQWRPTDAKQPNATFSKWRTESLKAYGNAIVPQVMYEIFKAIEEVEQSNQ